MIQGVRDVYYFNIQPYLRKKIKALLKDDNGIALPFFVSFLVISLLSLALVTDLGHLLISRHKMQSIADSASLAGASMTKVNGIYNAAGIPIGYTAVIDLQAAKNEAEAVIQKNIQELDLSNAGIVITNKTISSPNNKQVYVEIEYEVETMLLDGIDKVNPISKVSMKSRAISEIKL